jgi:hypothetical protein
MRASLVNRRTGSGAPNVETFFRTYRSPRSVATSHTLPGATSVTTGELNTSDQAPSS